MNDPTAIGKVIDKKIGKIGKSGKPIKGEDGRINNGGARIGGGMPKGKITRKRLHQLEVQKAVNQRIMAHADELLNAALSLAKGTQRLMVIITEGEGKNRRRYHEVVTDEETIKQYLDYEEGINDADNPDDDTHYYYLTTDKPDVRAIDMLMNRGLGKAPDKIEITGGFFMQNNLTVEVVGSKHADLEITDDGQITIPGEPTTESEDSDLTSPGPGVEGSSPSTDS